MSPKAIGRLSSAVVLAGVFCLVTFLAMTFSLSRVPTEFSWVEHTQEVQKGLRDVYSDALEIETGQRGYLLSGNKGYLASYTEGRDDLFLDLHRVQWLTADNPQQQADGHVLEGLLDDKEAECASLVAMRHEHTLLQVEAAFKHNPPFPRNAPFIKMLKIHEVVERMEGREDVLLEKRRRVLTRQDNMARCIGTLSGLLLFLFLCVAFVMARITKAHVSQAIAIIQGMRRPLPGITYDETNL